MKTFLGLLVAIGVLGCAIAFGSGCAHWHDGWEAKCGPQVDPLLKPCSCMDPRTLSCPPPPSDAKNPAKKTCYRLTMGCDDIEWDKDPDEHGVLHGKCHKADDTPREITCDDVPKPDPGVTK